MAVLFSNSPYQNSGYMFIGFIFGGVTIALLTLSKKPTVWKYAFFITISCLLVALLISVIQVILFKSKKTRLV